MAYIHIAVENTDTGKIKKEVYFKIPSLKRAATGAFIYSVTLRGLDKIRPPKRNIGALLNLYLAGVVTKAALDKIFELEEKTKVEDEVKEEQEKEVSIRWEVVNKDDEEEQSKEEKWEEE